MNIAPQQPPPPYTGEKNFGVNQTPLAPMYTQQPVFYGNAVFIPGEYPVQCVCPTCRQTIVTRTERQNGLLTWLLFGGLILIGCWLGCCLIPFCIDTCKDVAHYCPNCSALLGLKKHM